MQTGFMKVFAQIILPCDFVAVNAFKQVEAMDLQKFEVFWP